ncbi:restriction endonuclease [Dyella dinghuensis]|nr:restriction endonuclease [Dyella dinghuensis]
MHCGAWTDDHYDPNLWEIPFPEFAATQQQQIIDPEIYGFPPDDPDAILCGNISDRKVCLHICPECGWWIAEDRAVLPATGGQLWVVTLTSMSVLQELDLSNIDTPLQEVRRYLRRKFDARASMHPRLFELTVASVFRDFGCQAVATAYSNDGGIDAVLQDSAGRRIGVQVKRQKGAVQVEQIRAFLGALTLEGYTCGVFVSSSSFSRGAIRAAKRSTEIRTPISLVDANRFFDMLRYAQLSDISGPEDCGISLSNPPKFHLHSFYYLNSL